MRHRIWKSSRALYLKAGGKAAASDGKNKRDKEQFAALYIEEWFKETGITKAGSALKIKTSEHMELQPDYLPVQREPDKGFDAPHLKQLKTHGFHTESWGKVTVY